MKKKTKPFSSEELAYFCNQLALIMKSGISLNDGLIMLLDDIKDTYSKETVKSISDSVNSQQSLYASLEKTHAFPSYMISMIKIGETSGHLENVLEGLSEHYLRESALRSSVKSAVLHPVMLLVIMSAVVAVLLIKVMPIFKDVFVQIDAQLSGKTSTAINFATNTGVIALIIVGVIILAAALLYIASYTAKGKKFLYALFSKVFFLKGLSRKMSVAQFSSAIYLMLSSGFDNSEALGLAKDVVSNPDIKAKITECEDKVSKQESFSNAVADSEMFPALYNQMIKISYKSGAIDDVWHQIADKYDNEVNNSLDNIVSFIEPLLVALLTIIIGAILIAVLLPLMGIMTAMN